MTTNHPAHGPVSLDRLHQIREILSKAAAQSDGGNLGYAMADAVKVIDLAIAAFGAEPVVYAMQGVKLDTDAISICKNVVDGWVDEWNQERKPGVPEYKTGPLYTAPPAPVVPDEITPLQVSRAYGGEVRGYRDGWNACRAAMLKAGNSPVIGIDLASEPDRSVEVRYLAPPGYVIVPIVPTEDMIINGFESVPDPHFSDEKEWEEYEALSGCRQAARRAELCWAAMIKAAPKQENI